MRAAELQKELTRLTEENKRLKNEIHLLNDHIDFNNAITNYKQLFSHIMDAIYCFKIDSTGRPSKFLEVNAEGYKRLGYTKEEILNLHPYDINLQSEDKIIEFLRDIAQKESMIFETTHVSKDGRLIPVEIKTNIITTNEEQYILSVCRDISERKKTEESLHRLESFYNHSSEGIAIFDLDGKILDLNAAFTTIFGYTLEEVKGKRLPVTPIFSKGDAEYLLNETLKGNSIKDFETIKQKKNGEYITVSITMSPIRKEENGEVYALSGIVRDISEQRSTMIQLESFIDNNIDPILIFDNQEKLIKVNSSFEQVFGWKGNGLLGLSITDMPMIPEEKLTEASYYFNRVKNHEGIKGFETYRYTKNGEKIDVLLTSFAVQNDLNHNRWYVVSLKDIRDKKKAEKLILDTEKLSIAGELAASIAHEIRNPITAIKGFIQIIEHGSINQTYFDIINSEMNRIELILKELLLLAKPQAVMFQPQNIIQTLEQSIALLEAQANMYSVEIKTEIEPNNYTIFCEENRLKQVFINLIKNAIDAMPEGGVLRIHCENSMNQMITLRFTDEGYGIPESTLKRLGEPFYTTKDKGTGLGFMVCKNIIEEHNGKLNVYSEVNVGTTIEVMLPVRSISQNHSKMA